MGMRQAWKIQIVYWFTVSVVFGQLVACSEPASDESRLRQAVAEMEKAAEAKQMRPILGYLADDFLGNKVYRKANIGGMLLLQFRQNRHVHVFLHITGIKIKANRAHLRCELILAARDQRVVPERARVLVIDSDWQKHNGAWRVVRANWQDPFVQP
jgi:hypothetical protein